MTTEDTGFESMTTAEAIRPAGENQHLLVDKRDVLNRIVELGRDARDCDMVRLELPDPPVGLPSQILTMVSHTENGPHIIPVLPLFEPYRTAPERVRGTAKVTTLASFIDLVTRHKDANSAIFAKTLWPAPALTAIINYHVAAPDDLSAARFADHRIQYDFPLTPEFKAWMQWDGELMEQGAFALFLDDHVDELAAPYDTEVQQYERLFKEKLATPVELVGLSRSLEVYVGAKIKRQERPASGERTVVFESQHQTANGDPVVIPGVFMVSIRAFIDGDPLRIPARLRYRVKGGDIHWCYQLYRPDYWLRTRVQNDLLHAVSATGLPAYEGAAE